MHNEREISLIILNCLFFICVVLGCASFNCILLNPRSGFIVSSNFFVKIKVF